RGSGGGGGGERPGGGVVLTPCRRTGWVSLSAPQQQAQDAGSGADGGEGGRGPEEEHPLEQLALQLGELRVELRVEPGKVELVLFPQFGPICGVHVVEPLHELVGDLVAEGIVELA